MALYVAISDGRSGEDEQAMDQVVSLYVSRH